MVTPSSLRGSEKGAASGSFLGAHDWLAELRAEGEGFSFARSDRKAGSMVRQGHLTGKIYRQNVGMRTKKEPRCLPSAPGRRRLITVHGTIQPSGTSPGMPPTGSASQSNERVLHYDTRLEPELAFGRG